MRKAAFILIAAHTFCSAIKQKQSGTHCREATGARFVAHDERHPPQRATMNSYNFVATNDMWPYQ